MCLSLSPEKWLFGPEPKLICKVKSKQASKLFFSFSSLQCDYSLVQSNFAQLEAQCKASWEQLKILDKSEDKRKGKSEKRRWGGQDDAPEGSLRHRLPKLLKECEERLKVLRAVHRRVINRCARFVASF